MQGDRFMRRFTLFVLLAGLLVLVAPAHANDPPATWTAWLHYGRHMTLIDSNGDVLREVDLPFDASFRYELLQVSPDGEKVAYWMRARSEGVSYPSLITVYSLADNLDNREIFTYMLPENVRVYQPTDKHKAFDESGSFLAAAYHVADLGWEIVVLNIDIGEEVYRLTDEVVPDVDGEYTPVVRDFRGVNIAFALNSSFPGNLAYTWNTATDTVLDNLAYLNLHSDTFAPTGEVVMQYAHDGRFYHDLFVYDPVKRARYPFFAISTYTADVFFVQNGERIIDQMYWPMGAANWILIERDGTRIDDFGLGFYSPGTIPAYINVAGVRGTVNGFIYTLYFELLESRERLPLPAVYEVNTRDDTLDIGRVVWQISMKDFHAYFDSPEDAYFDIAWVHSDAPVGPFKPWAQLAELVYAPTPPPSAVTITPTLIPTPPPLFHVGQTVRVQTIDGEILNLRAAPTRQSDILIYIEDESRLELLEGPVEAEGFHWWRVRLPDGLEGWVVENDGDLQTLMPE